jgi:hypothetical protein
MQLQRDEKAVKEYLYAAVSKCGMGLGISMNQMQVITLVEDIIDVYLYDAIEDVVLALKKGRQGDFGNTYNKLNMVVVKQWMAYVLEEKAIEREKQNNAMKIQSDPLPGVDYEAYKARMAEEANKPKEKTPSELEYEAYKFNYFNTQNNE